MLKGTPVLIVENEHLIALGLSLAVEDNHGTVIGPVATVAEALTLIARGSVGAAILDASLDDRDVTPVALCLIAQDVPFVVHTGTGLPVALAAQYPDLPVVMKPRRSQDVIATLVQHLRAN
jgi:DNA-binding NarL/FixJ family response regulator